MSTTTPAMPTLSCVWCGLDFPRSEMGNIPGTKICLCRECWKRYQGDESDQEENDGHR